MPELITQGRKSKYPWPASAINPDLMALVYAVRESSHPRVPISELIARAVRETYGQERVLNLPTNPEPQDIERKAA